MAFFKVTWKSIGISWQVSKNVHSIAKSDSASHGPLLSSTGIAFIDEFWALFSLEHKQWYGIEWKTLKAYA